MASQNLKGKHLLNKIRKENRKRSALLSRMAVLNNKVNKQNKVIEKLVLKFSKEDLELYKELLTSINV